MPLAEKGVRRKGRQPFAPPQHAETRSANALLSELSSSRWRMAAGRETVASRVPIRYSTSFTFWTKPS